MRCSLQLRISELPYAHPEISCSALYRIVEDHLGQHRRFTRKASQTSPQKKYLDFQLTLYELYGLAIKGSCRKSTTFLRRSRRRRGQSSPLTLLQHYQGDSDGYFLFLFFMRLGGVGGGKSRVRRYPGNQGGIRVMDAHGVQKQTVIFLKNPHRYFMLRP